MHEPSIRPRHLRVRLHLAPIDGDASDGAFVDLVDQRGQVIEMLQALPADPYRGSADFAALDAELRPLEMQIQYKARAWLNRSRRRNAAVHSYDTGEGSPVGSYLNRRH